jgi:hypothetical protein
LFTDHLFEGLVVGVTVGNSYAVVTKDNIERKEVLVAATGSVSGLRAEHTT